MATVYMNGKICILKISLGRTLNAIRLHGKFNFECAPWTGGFFERIVKMVKRCLRKVLRTSKLNYDEFTTILKYKLLDIINRYE